VKAGGNLFFVTMHTTIQRVTISDEALAVVQELRKQHGDLLFHQSGGCCDGSQPMCFEKNDFILGSIDICLGEVAGCEFWMSKDQFEYWKATQLHLHITSGRGSSFSLEIPLGLRFIVQSRLFEEWELPHLNSLKEVE
jgi:uncharacterized protein (DUF779 family)